MNMCNIRINAAGRSRARCSVAVSRAHSRPRCCVGVSLVRNRHPIGPYSRTMSRLLRRSEGARCSAAAARARICICDSALGRGVQWKRYGGAQRGGCEEPRPHAWSMCAASFCFCRVNRGPAGVAFRQHHLGMR